MARAARREAEESEAQSREGISSDLLTNPECIATDLKLVKKSLRWGLNATKRRAIVSRLCKISEKEFTTRISKDGDEILDEELAEKHALEAMKILVQIGAQQQRDEHLDKRLTHNGGGGSDHPKQTTINVGVNVDNRIDEQRAETLAIARRIQQSRILPDAESGGS